MAKQQLEKDCSYVKDFLLESGYDHLKVRCSGLNIIVYSEDAHEKVNRCRFTKGADNEFMLSVADHLGKWEVTPYTDTIANLVALTMENFGFVLSEW